ncbi:uncharacterized protein OCT59_026790 [Rhizophagus irregularis]|uniref:uncharacterized protein n=1 Tax=Rhizophagus irregularis TaxID=588596 RepID=UPI003317F6F3|nr:hypothetical protein OCT59_026790 [Rhizophagus irregularis]
MIFINRSSSSKDHSGDSITLLVISWGAKQDVFQKSVAKRDVSQKSVKGSEDGGDGLRIYEDVDHNVEGFGEPFLIIENDDVVDRIVTKKNITILEIRFLRVFARKRCLSIYLYI